MKIAFSLMFFWTQCILASAMTAESVELKPTRVAVYKNGQAYLTQECKIGSDSQYLMLHNIASPAYGTFWWSLTGDVKVKNFVTRSIDKMVPNLDFDLIQLVNANKGKRITVSSRNADGSLSSISGIVLGHNKPEKARNTFVHGVSESRHENGEPTEYRMIVLETDDKQIVVINPNASTEMVTGPELKIPDKKEVHTEAVLELLGSAKGQTLTTTSLSSGVLWAPAYKVEIKDDKKISIQGQATVWNELMDMKDVHMELTTGYLELKYAQLLAPFSLQNSMGEFIAYLSGGNVGARIITGGNRTGSVFSPRSLSLDTDPFAESSAPQPYKIPEVENKNDMSYYKIAPFTCAKNETVTVDFVSFETEYSTIYTANFNQTDVNRFFENSSNSHRTEVWSSLVFQNMSDQPLTAAPIEFVNGGNLISQGLFEYTPKGAEAKIRMNQSLDCTATRQETLKNREEGTKNIFGVPSFIYSVEGEVVLKNQSDKSMTMEVSADISGMVKEDSLTDGATVTLNGQGAFNLNPMNKITWKMVVPPKQEVKRSYAYSYKMPR